MADNRSPELLGQTPWQPVGPFFHFGLLWKGGADLVGGTPIGARPELTPQDHYLLREPTVPGPVEGRRIELLGQVLDGQGAPVPDAMLEIWQADAAGRYAAAVDSRGEGEGERASARAFTGFGRAGTAEDGSYRFVTIMPGRLAGPRGGLQAAHIALGVLGPGLIRRLVTRVYFEDEPGNDDDPILALVPAPRRATLIARRGASAGLAAAAPVTAAAPAPGSAPAPSAGAVTVYRFDVRLQGLRETVFFNY